jgi:glycosyltransferase involved in cell wall biosynthesis
MKVQVKTRPQWRELLHNPQTQHRTQKALMEESMRAFRADLKPIRIRGALKPGDVPLICVLRNEAVRLPLFFDHYKKLGVDRFFMVDNASTDGSMELLLAEQQADIFFAESSFFESYFGNYWWNGISQTYCRGHWTLVADADELLVYDGMERHDIKDFGKWLGRQGADRAFVPMIDLYTSGTIGARQRSISEMLAEDSWFDTKGYRLERYPSGWRVIGGPRERLFNTAEHSHIHWISKYPFFQVTDKTVLFDNHFLWPWDQKYRGPDAAFLHLKIFDDFRERCAVNEQENEHALNSAAYRTINHRLAELPDLIAVDEDSRRYRGPQSLIDNGLLLPIDWTNEDRKNHPPSASAGRVTFEQEAPRDWIKVLPASGLVWNRFDEYNTRSDNAVETHLEVIRCAGPLASGEIAVICVLRNEAKRLPLFFDHYKQMGINRFFMVDNGSDDGSHELLLAEPLADVFVAHASFVDGHFGLYWSNGLARKYCQGHWILVADADELLVYDGMEKKSLPDLADWLDAHGRDRLFTIMVDVYPSGSVGAEQRSLADILVEDCWFDSEGYSLEASDGGWLLTGGPRHRLFNRGRATPYRHWISKHPFFRMEANRAIVSHHWIWPMDWRMREPQGAFLHLKLMDDFLERSARYEREGQHAHGSRSYKLINERLSEMPQVEFFHPNSRRYRGPKSLIRYRVIQTIGWQE